MMERRDTEHQSVEVVARHSSIGHITAQLQRILESTKRHSDWIELNTETIRYMVTETNALCQVLVPQSTIGIANNLTNEPVGAVDVALANRRIPQLPHVASIQAMRPEDQRALCHDCVELMLGQYCGSIAVLNVTSERERRQLTRDIFLALHETLSCVLRGVWEGTLHPGGSAAMFDECIGGVSLSSRRRLAAHIEADRGLIGDLASSEACAPSETTLAICQLLRYEPPSA